MRQTKTAILWQLSPLKTMWTPPPPSPNPDQVGMENCKQLFSQLLAIYDSKIADIISAVKLFTVFDTDRGILHALKAMCHAFLACLSRAAGSAIKAMCHPLSVCLSCSAGSAIEAISLALHSGASVWHIALRLSLLHSIVDRRWGSDGN